MSLAATATPPAPPAAPRRRRHRLRNFLIVLVLAVAIVVALVQAFLTSDYPRQIAIRVAQNVTGLRVEIGKITIGWSGATRIDDLRVGLPLEAEPFLTVPRVDARHTPLLGILLTQNVAIDSLVVRQPHVDVRQDKEGVWNLQQVLNQLATPGKNAAPAGGATHLPDVDLADATARVTLADGRAMDVADVALVARRKGELKWTFNGHVAGLVTAKGTVSPAGRWPHEATMVVRPELIKALRPLVDVAAVLSNLGPLVGPTPGVVSAELDWSGERTPTGVTGRLTVPEKSTQAGSVIAAGTAVVTVDGSTIRVAPDGFTVTAPGLPPVTLAGGSATFVGNTLTLADLRTRFADGSMRLDGAGDLAARHGSLTASWEQIAFPPGVVHQGHATLEAADVWPGRPWVKGTGDLLATVAGGTFEAKAAVSGDGPRWSDATYVVDLPVVRYSRRSELRLENTSLVLHNTADTVSLQSVKVSQPAAANATLDARGLYHFAGPEAGTGYVAAVGEGFAFGGQRDLGFNVNAWADAGAATLQNAYAHLGASAWANLAGQYVFSRPEPIEMRLDLDSDPNLSLQLSNTLSVGGHVGGSMKVGGTLAPTHVTVDGRLTSRGFKFQNLLVGDADLLVRGELLPDRADVRTERLRALGGEGWFGAEFPYFSDELHAWMGFDHIDLARVAAAVNLKDVTGAATGALDVHLPVGQLRGMYGVGAIDVDRPAAGTMIAAKTLSIPVHIGDGYVRVLPSADQDAGGQARVSALMSLNDPTKLKLSVTLRDWLTPLPLEEFSVLSGGDVDLPQIDLANRAASGSVAVDTRLFAHNDPIGDTSVRLHADGQNVKLERVTGEVLGGTVYGQGDVNFRQLAQAQLWAGVEGLSLDRLAKIDPRLTGMAGHLSVRLFGHPADVPDPLGPVQMELEVDSDHATYKGIEIGNTRVRAFGDSARVALADDPQRPNRISLAGGTARLWGRLGQVPAAQSPAAQIPAGQVPAGQVPAGQGDVSRTSAFVSVHLDRLDTEQLNKMIDPDGKPVPGRLSGDITAFGNPGDARRLSGQGRLRLTDSDLANVGVFAVLYDAMHLGFGAGTPRGEGEVAFRLNAGRLDVTSLNYFNRGVYAKGSLSIADVLDLKNSPVSGYVLGTFRPLKDIKLPFFGTIDSILDALQSSATTLRIDGTMKHIRPTPVSLKNVSGDLKNILVGESQAK